MAARATARVRRRECSDAGRRANTWRSTCQQRYRWHLEKNATQMMPATGVVAYGMILCPLSSEMPPACDQASVYLSRQPRQPRRPTDKTARLLPTARTQTPSSCLAGGWSRPRQQRHPASAVHGCEHRRHRHPTPPRNPGPLLPETRSEVTQPPRGWWRWSGRTGHGAELV